MHEPAPFQRKESWSIRVGLFMETSANISLIQHPLVLAIQWWMQQPMMVFTDFSCSGQEWHSRTAKCHQEQTAETNAFHAHIPDIPTLVWCLYFTAEGTVGGKKRCSIFLKKFMSTYWAGILQHSSLGREQYMPCQNVDFLENSVMMNHVSQ